jgi:hypothetical protein
MKGGKILRSRESNGADTILCKKLFVGASNLFIVGTCVLKINIVPSFCSFTFANREGIEAVLINA